MFAVVGDYIHSHSLHNSGTLLPSQGSVCG